MSLVTHLEDFSHPASLSVRLLGSWTASSVPYRLFIFLLPCTFPGRMLCDSCVLPVRGPLEACRGLMWSKAAAEQ